MAGRIANLLKRPTPERPDVAAAADQLLTLGEQRSDLHAAATWQVTLLRAAFAAPAPVTLLSLDTADVTTKLRAGVPLLRNVPLPFSERDLRGVFVRLCDSFERAANNAKKHENTLQSSASDIRAIRGSNVFGLARQLIDGEGGTLPAALEERGMPVELTLTLLRMALLPFLEQIAAQLEPLRANERWRHGYCPTCGAWPVFAEQRGLDLVRYARCGLCASAWQLDRVACAFCGTRDHSLLGYVQVEGEEQQRAATCDNCHSYLKLRSTLTRLTTAQLLVDEVALMHLDVIAMEKGYVPPA